MNCRQYQDEILLYAGADQLPDDLQQHLETCEDCSRAWNELKQSSDDILAVEPLLPEGIDIERLVAKTVSRLPEKQKPIIAVSRLRYWSAAAAVVLVAGVLSIITFLGQEPETELAANSLDSMSIKNDLLVELYASDFNDPGDASVDLLLQDFADQGFFEASETLLEDLTTSELEYLEANFNVWELL